MKKKVKKAKKRNTFPSHTFEDTSDPNLKRYLDRNGDWTHYFLVKENVFVPAVNHILGLGFNKGSRFYQYLLSVTPEEAKRKLEQAGDEGTRTHAAIRQLIDGSKVTMTTKFRSDIRGGRQEVLNPEEWDNLIAFKAFCDRYNPRVVSNDFSIYALKVGSYAGSPDALLVITVPSGDKWFPKSVWGQDILFMPDWKTSQAVYNEYKAQLAAYFAGVEERGTYSKFFTAFEGKIFTGIVRLGTRHKEKFEVTVWDEKETRDNYTLFQAAVRIYLDSVGGEEKAAQSEDVPMQFYIKMKKAKAKKQKPLSLKKAVDKAEKIIAKQLPLI